MINNREEKTYPNRTTLRNYYLNRDRTLYKDISFKQFKEIVYMQITEHNKKIKKLKENEYDEILQ